MLMNAPSWKDIRIASESVVQAAKGGKLITNDWTAFADLVQQTRDNPPEPLRMMLASLREIQGGRSPEDIRILDHGCGSGLKGLYLNALGYTHVYGVTVGSEVEHLNRILKDICGIHETRFITTDGRELPFPDAFFDFIYSNQVLEHVSDDKIDMYYSEEGRVLRPGGGAFHEVPHILVPYDAHSRVWLAHMMPRFLKPLFYGVFKSLEQRKFLLHQGPAYVKHYESRVFLRSPFYHRRQIAHQIGPYRDLTLARLLESHSFVDYDRDGSLRARKFIDRLVKLPVVGRWFASIFRNMVMLQTIALKKG